MLWGLAGRDGIKDDNLRVTLFRLDGKQLSKIKNLNTSRFVRVILAQGPC